MNTNTLRLEQLSGKTKTSSARKTAVKSHGSKAAPKRRPTTVELVEGLRRFKWDFDAMKRV